MAKLSIHTTLQLGHEMPVLGIGTWKSEPGKVAAAVEEALKLGYRHVDAAEVYENEKEVGEGIARAIKSGYITREDLWVTSKLWITDYRQERVRPAVKKILKDLGLDYVNQILMHWPVALRPESGELFPKNDKGHFDTDVDVDLVTTWKELEKLVDEGYMRTIGVSNFNEKEVQLILDNARIAPAANQVECHPYLPQNELKAFLESKQMAMVAYSPLANDSKAKSALTDPEVEAIAKECGKTPAQVVLRWNLQRGVVVIPKSVTPSRIAENCKLFDFELNDSQMKKLNALGTTKPMRQLNVKFRANDVAVFP